MGSRSLHPLLDYLRRLSVGKTGDAALEDAQCLHRFLKQRDENAFTILVQRYGTMVWGLCVRLLGESPEAEDAFQATFLVLARKAASLRGPQLLGPWLYGVTYRTALKLRGQKARRTARETQLPEQLAEERPEPMWSELRQILDEEINRLPTKYRLPVLLCSLQGLSSEEAAQRLGCAKGTIFSRLSRARDLLRRRLLCRGVDVSIGALSVSLTVNATLRAAVPTALHVITIRTCLLFAAGSAGQSLPAPLAALVEGVVRSMFLSKVKFAAIVVLVLVVIGSGAGLIAHRTNASPPSTPLLFAEHKVKEPNEASVPPPAKSSKLDPSKLKTDTPAQPEVENFPRAWRERLNMHVKFDGIDDSRVSLIDALDLLGKRYNLPYRINEKAFRADNSNLDVFVFEFAKKRPLPPMNAKLSTILQRILGRLPTKSGALWLIRKDYIEITTGAAVRAELGIPSNRPLLPLVWNSFENIPISEALITLSADSGYNVITDPRASEKLQTPTGITVLYNVPVDTAVRLMANIAGLTVVRLDNVLFVTTNENAKQLREAQAKTMDEENTSMTARKPAAEKPANENPAN
jgi:RNA polymerase sigma factor (sigma-70 family)